MFNKYPPTATLLMEVQPCWGRTSLRPEGASGKQHSRVTHPREPSDSPSPMCQGIHPALTATSSLPGSSDGHSCAFGNGAKLRLLNPGSLQILPNGNSDL